VFEVDIRMKKFKEILDTTFTGESLSNMKYLLFAEVAKRDGKNEIAILFKQIADKELEHARALFNMQYPQISTKDVLKMAIDNENSENKMYQENITKIEKEKPNLNTAELRRLMNESIEHFKTFADVEKEHLKEYQKARELLYPGI
jgi:rubrerythrin